MPFLSVVMPVYNAEDYIGKTVQSVLDQDFPDLELLCIDDCSSDDTYAKLKDLENTDSRVRVFRTKKNSGAGAARNLGLDVAKGRYVTFLDADDALEPSLYGKVQAALAEDAEMADEVVWGIVETSRKVAGSRTYVILPGSGRLYDLDESSEIIFELEEKTLFGYVWNSAYRKRIIDEARIRFRDAYYYEDFWFNLDFIKNASTIRTVDYPGYHYQRINSGSITSRNSSSYYELSRSRVHDLADLARDTGCENENVMDLLGNRMVRYFVSAMARKLKYDGYGLGELRTWIYENLSDDWLQKTVRDARLKGMAYRAAGHFIMKKNAFMLSVCALLCRRMV